MRNRTPVAGVAILGLLLSWCAGVRAEGGAATQGAAIPVQPPAYFTNPGAPPVDQPGLPRVLLLGDSITIGYTCPLRTFLKNKAVVYHPADNGRNSAYLLAHLTGEAGQAWLGTKKWDVIHFNCGIWDTFYVDKKTGQGADETRADPQSIRLMAPPEEYRANLTKIVAILQAAGDRVIWASSTPVSDRKGARFEDMVKYNAIAAEVMKEHGVEVDDLYTFVRPHTPEWQMDFCHFDVDGYALIGEQAGKCILGVLAKPAPGAK